MAELKDFLLERTASLSDFVTEVSQSPMWSRPSAQNTAAHSALMSDKPIETYDRVMGELKSNGSSRIQEDYLQAYQDSVMQGSKGVVGEIFSQESISLEDKAMVAEGYTSLNKKKPTQHEALINTAIIAPVTGEDRVAENSRIDISTRIPQINETRSQMQSMLNAELAKNDQGVMGVVDDLIAGLAPFVWNEQLSKVRTDLGEDEFTDIAENFVLSGNSRAAFRDLLRNTDDADRIDLTKKIIEVVNKHPGTILDSESKLEASELLRIGLDQGYYTSTDEWIDNAISVMESTGILYPVAKAVGVVRAVKGSYNAAARMVKRDSVKSPVAPHSASQAYKEGNPEKYRELNKAIMLDDTGELAEATYGASRIDAIGHDIAREVLQPFDIVKNKVEIADIPVYKITPNARIVDVASRNGAIYLTEVEKAGVAAKVVNDFKAANGVVARPAMLREGTIIDGVEGTAIDDRVVIRAVYGPKDGGFGGVDFLVDSTGEASAYSNVRSAVDRVQAGLRHYGIGDDDIEILVRQGEHYQPVPLHLVNPTEENFLVQVKHNYKIKADDVNFTPFDVKWNSFDSVTALTGDKQGSLSRHLLAPSSMLKKPLTFGANAAVDQGALLSQELLNLGKGFTDIFDNLDMPRQSYLFEEIKRANFEGKALDLPRLVADGATENEIKALGKWKEYWDTHYYLENNDKLQTYRSRGYEAVENTVNGTKIYARPLARNKVAGSQRVYDVDADEIVSLDKEAITKLYDEGGHFSTPHSNIEVAGELAGPEALPILVRNQPGSTISRGLRDGEEVLNYREGYYSVKYDAPYYIEKVVTKPDGKKYSKAVSVAGSIRDAEKYAANLTKSDGGEYRVRWDVKNESERQDLDIQLAQSGGRSAQRVRGQRLEDATEVMNSGVDHQYVMGPVDALISSAKSISNRVAMRDYMEAGKGRFLSQFGELLPKNTYGEPMWPSNISQIGRSGEIPSKQLADARTTFEYLNYLENGYVNGIDDGMRAMMRRFAVAAGRSNWTKAEKAAYAAGNSMGPTGFAKNAAFNLYLVLNPLRQLIVQGHQAVQLAAIHPVYASTRLAPDTALLMSARMMEGASNVDKNLIKSMGRSREEVQEMFEGYRDSGLSAAIDRQNLVRGSLAEFADDLTYKASAQGALNKGTRGVAHVLNASRRVGFDMGEEINMMTAWLAHYDKAKQAAGGRKLNQTDWDNIRAEARDFTYNMNMAGDMPYNQNWLGALFQFMQVPHKAILQMSFNRNLTGRQKGQLAMYNALMYGVPPGSIMYYQLEKQLPEDGEMRDMALQGLEAYTLNTLLSLTTGEETSINFSGLAAVDATGVYEFVTNLVTTDGLSLLTESPSGSLVFGNNPRIREAVRSILKVTNFMPEDGPFDTTYLSTIEQTLSLSSGFSNFFKARAAMKLGQHKNAYGNVNDSSVTKAEAIAKLFGFETNDQMRARYISQEAYEATDAYYTDLEESYRLAKLQMSRIGKDFDSLDNALDTINWMNVVFEDSPKSKEWWFNRMKKDAENGDDTMWVKLIKMAGDGILDDEKFRQLIREMPDSEARPLMEQIIQDQDTIRQENRNG